MFGDKPFVEGDLDWALSLFEGVSPFLLSQILNLPMERWMAIEAGDLEDEGKQRGGVLGQWGKRGSAAMWSVLVEALVELGLKGRAQTACIEKGLPQHVIGATVAISKFIVCVVAIPLFCTYYSQTVTISCYRYRSFDLNFCLSIEH